MNRIEKAREIGTKEEAQGIGRKMAEKVSKKLKLKPFPQPLDDKELREKTGNELGYALYCDYDLNLSDKEKLELADIALALLQPKIEEARRQIKVLALQAIADEPEFPGDMPDELWKKLNRNRINTLRAMQNGVRLTKNGITERFLQALSGKGGEPK